MLPGPLDLSAGGGLRLGERQHRGVTPLEDLVDDELPGGFDRGATFPPEFLNAKVDASRIPTRSGLKAPSSKNSVVSTFASDMAESIFPREA